MCTGCILSNELCYKLLSYFATQSFDDEDVNFYLPQLM